MFCLMDAVMQGKGWIMVELNRLLGRPKRKVLKSTWR
jgi:hypothetical protein